jgi:hypothetical protein
VRSARLITTLVLAAGLVLAACNGDDDDASGDTTATTRATTTAASPTASTTPPRAGDLRLVSLNINSGDSCPADTDHCQAPDRIDYLVDLVTKANCPQVVALQDTAPWIKDLLTERLPNWCSGQYTIHGEADAPDRSLIITSLAVSGEEQVALAGSGRTAVWARLGDDSGGQIDVVVSRTGAGGDTLGAGSTACGTTPETTCPAPCTATGTVFDCQITQLGALVQSKRDANSSLVVVAGDLGVSHDNQALSRTFWTKGWRDAYLDAGNQECDPKFNIGCTSGRASTGEELMSALTSYQAVENARTDYVLVSPSLACSPRFDAAADADADGIGTGLFANRGVDEIRRFNGIVWPSDHIGISIDVSCI